MIKKIEKLITQYREVLSYLFFGVCTTLINIITYFVCSKTGMDTATATVIAWVLSVLFAYLTNRYFVFENRADNAFGILREAISFFSCRLATGVLDLVIMLIFVDILHQNDLLIKILSNIQACEAMEMGAAAVMANTALATAGDLPLMASAFRNAVEAGRKAYLAGLGRVLTRGAAASDPLTGFLRDQEAGV